MLKKNFVLLAPVLFLTGCVSMHNYPAEWAQLNQSIVDSCPQISGTYRNRGERTTPGQSYLAYQLFPNGGESSTRANSVDIQALDSNTLSIRVLSGQNILKNVTLVRGKGFSCEEGFLVISQGSYGVGEGGGLGVGRGTLFLALSKDGYLTVKEVSGVVGVVMIIPVAGFIRQWSRYAPTE